MVVPTVGYSTSLQGHPRLRTARGEEPSTQTIKTAQQTRNMTSGGTQRRPGTTQPRKRIEIFLRPPPKHRHHSLGVQEVAGWGRADWTLSSVRAGIWTVGGLCSIAERGRWIIHFPDARDGN